LSCLMADSRVALTRCSDYEPLKVAEAVARQFALLGGVERFVKRGDRVLVKPNFIAPRSHRHATQTHPAVIVEVARLLKDFGARPFVGDSSAWANAWMCAKALKLDEPLKALGVPIRTLGRPKWRRIGEDGTYVGLSRVALDADVIINLPKFKSHQQLRSTFAVKNMFGCVTGKWKPVWHLIRGGDAGRFCRLLIDIYRYMNPAVTIIDGVMAMDGRGPIRGRTRPLGWLVGGTDPIACERVCCELIGAGPELMPIIRTAGEIGFGCADMERIEVVGDGIGEGVCRDFELPELAPIRFSLYHVFRSVCKQVVLVAKSMGGR
jgi:uncharacterized protein (DUF362 family)